jgi:hypothetical protein
MSSLQAIMSLLWSVLTGKDSVATRLHVEQVHHLFVPRFTIANKWLVWKYPRSIESVSTMRMISPSHQRLAWHETTSPACSPRIWALGIK